MRMRKKNKCGGDSMVFVYIIFVWLILMIIYNIWIGKKEKGKMTISKGGMRKYFNGRFKW